MDIIFGVFKLTGVLIVFGVVLLVSFILAGILDVYVQNLHFYLTGSY